MPHSLRAKLKGLNYKKILTDRELERLCKALDNENVLEQIRAEIQHLADLELLNMKLVLQIIDKYKAENEGQTDESDN